DTDSDISSLVSSVSGSGTGAGGGGRRHGRDPAALLASAVARAGQVKSIPAPSAGSPEQAGRRLPPLEEGVPLSRAMLSPSYVMSPRRGAGGSRQGAGGPSFVEMGDE
ncbi:unnamed protein product, partial [Laminaria digitata]